MSVVQDVIDAQGVARLVGRFHEENAASIPGHRIPHEDFTARAVLALEFIQARAGNAVEALGGVDGLCIVLIGTSVAATS